MPPAPAPRERGPPPRQRKVTAAELPVAQKQAQHNSAAPSTSLTAAALVGAVEAEMMAQTEKPRQASVLPVIPPPPQSAPPGNLEGSSTSSVEPTPPSSRQDSLRAARMSIRAADGGQSSMGRAAMGRAVRGSIVAARLANADQLQTLNKGGAGPVRTLKGSEAQVAPEEQFRLSLEQRQQQQGASLNAAGLPLPKFEPPLEKAMPPLQAELPKGQVSQLEAAVLERTKQLNRLFEDQVKKQYDAMRREVSKLAKAHQKDVMSLDQRFKMKMQVQPPLATSPRAPALRLRS